MVARVGTQGEAYGVLGSVDKSNSSRLEDASHDDWYTDCRTVYRSTAIGNAAVRDEV